MTELRLFVQDLTGLAGPRPVTGGVPLAEGAAPDGVGFALREDGGEAVPLHVDVISRWKDGSARWALLDFQADPLPHGRRDFVLTWGHGVESFAPERPVSSGQTGEPRVETGDVSVSPGDMGLLNLSDRAQVSLVLVTREGVACPAVFDAAGVETAGRVRSTLALRGAFQAPTGERILRFRLRATVYAGLSRVRLEPMLLMAADSGVLPGFRELRLDLRPAPGGGRVRLGGEPGWEGEVGTEVRLRQMDDRHYRLEGAEGEGDRAPGWGEMEDGEGTLAVALRDFWRRWPTSVESSEEGLSVGLLPRFEEGDFADVEPWHKYQYLFEGDAYRLRTGQTRRWEVWADLGGDGASLARMADAPLVPSADPAQAVATGVWGPIAPAGAEGMAAYDAWAANLFNIYCDDIESQRDYGAMNWGDWYGERKVNWGNHEYDTPNLILLQFARTGDPRYFHMADAAARHYAEVDTIHSVNADLAEHLEHGKPMPGFPPRPGMIHQHTVGHVSGYYAEEQVRELFTANAIGRPGNPYLCLDARNLGHVWVEGMARHACLTGDPFMRETVELVGDSLARLVEDGEFKGFMGHSHCGRTTGWPLIAMAAVYKLGLDRRYLDAMKTLVDMALAEQDPHCGGWLFELPWGHCNCETRKHVGMAGFLTGVLVNGLSRYHDLSGDARLPEAIERAITWMDLDTWQDAWRDWQYTSCPASNPVGQIGVQVMAHVNAVRIAGNAEHLRVLRRAWQAKSERLCTAMPTQERQGRGKTFSTSMYGCPEAVALLAR